MSIANSYEFVADGEPEILKEFFRTVREMLDFDMDNAPHCEGILNGIRELIEDTEAELAQVSEVLCD